MTLPKSCCQMVTSTDPDSVCLGSMTVMQFGGRPDLGLASRWGLGFCRSETSHRDMLLVRTTIPQG